MTTLTKHAGDTRISPTDLTARALHRRAVEAVIWGMPAVNAELMFQAMREAEGRLQPGRLLVSAGQLEEPDADAQPRHDLPHAVLQHEGRRADGAGDSARRGRELDHRQRGRSWQTAIEDVGPAGVDKGKGGKYLDPAAGLQGARCPTGYIAMPSETYTGFALLRSNLKSGSDADIAKAVAYGKRIKFYPLSQGGQSARRSSSMRSTSYSTAPSPTTCVSFRRSIASCRASRG